MSETRSNTEAFQLPLLVSERLGAPALKVQFRYFSGQLPWATHPDLCAPPRTRNLTGPLVAALLRRLYPDAPGARARGSRRSAGQRERRDSVEGGAWNVSELGDELRRCSSCVAPWPRSRRASRQARRDAGVPRSEVVPHRRRSFWLVRHVGHWDVRITKSRSTSSVTGCTIFRLRVRRSRMTEAPSGDVTGLRAIEELALTMKLGCAAKLRSGHGHVFALPTSRRPGPVIRARHSRI